MVVIGVLIMLTGLLMPSVSGSLAAARRSNNLLVARQCHLLIELYCNDHKDVYPIGDKNAYHAQVKWHEVVLTAGYADHKIVLDGKGMYPGNEDWARFSVSMAMVYDPKRMMPGRTVDIGDADSMPIKRSSVAWPQDKGEIVDWHAGSSGPLDTWCCAQNQPIGPVVMADGAGTLRRWRDFVAADGGFYVENSIGYPVLSTWGGIDGRDWPPQSVPIHKEVLP